MSSIPTANGTVVLSTHQSTTAYTHQSKTEARIIIFSYFLLMVAIIIGNALIMGAFVFERRLRRNANILIMGLATADLLVGLVLVPCWLMVSARYHYTWAFYHFYITCDIFLSCASLLQLTSISIERCHAILYPIKHRVLVRKVFYIALAMAWVYAALVALFEPIQYGKWEQVYTVFYALTCYFFPLIIISAAYGTIFRAAKKGKGSKYLKRYRFSCRNERRLSLTVACITLLFVITWLPMFSLSVMATYWPNSLPGNPATSHLVHIVKWMHYSNSSINPFLYSYRSPDIKRAIHIMVSRLLGKRDQVWIDSWVSTRSRKTSFSTRKRTSSGSTLQASSRKTSTGSEPDKDKRKISKTSTNYDQNNNPGPFVIVSSI